MHYSRFTVLIFLFAFIVSSLLVIAPTESLSAQPPAPTFSINILKIRYNITLINSTNSNGDYSITFYNQADLEILFSTSSAAEYANNGYSLFYDLRYKNHLEPEWLTGWHSAFDENNYPKQGGSVRATTANCSITYSSKELNLDFQARIITARPFTQWHYERIDNKWVRVNQTVLRTVGTSDWSNAQTITGLNGFLPVTPAPSNQPIPIPSSTSPTPSVTVVDLGGNQDLFGWIQVIIPFLVGISGFFILLGGLYKWRKGIPKTRVYNFPQAPP